MIDPQTPQIAKVDGQPSSPIIDQRPSPASGNDLPDDRLTAPQDDPESIHGTIRPSIPQRSHEAGEASPDAARHNGPDGLQSSPNIGEACDVPPDDRGPSTRSETADQSAIDAFPSPAPSTSQTLENCQKPSTRRSRPNVLPTNPLHSEAGDHGLTPRGSWKNARGAHLSTARCVRSSIGYCTEFRASASAGARYPLP